MGVADDAWAVATHVLAIKANPPTYRKVVADLGELMTEAFDASALPRVDMAVSSLASIASDDQLDAAVRERKAGQLIDALEQSFVDDGAAISAEMAPKLGRLLAFATKLGRDEVATPMGWEIGWTLPDADAVHGLNDAGLFWIGKRYGDALDWDKMKRGATVIASQGLGREEAGKQLAAMFAGDVSRNTAYWEGLAATVATRARSFGALTAMTTAGAVSYEYVNPLDERTSDVCRHLDGTVFTLRQSVELRDKMLGAKTPDDARAIAPWPKVGNVLGLDGKPLAAAELQARGIAWPPLHFHCRSSIDVHTWGDLPLEADPLGNVDLSGKVKPPAKPRAPRKPKAPAAAPIATPAPTVAPTDPWGRAKAALDLADAQARAAGLDPDKFCASDAFRVDFLAWKNNLIHSATTPAAAPRMDWGTVRAVDNLTPGRKAMVRIRELLAAPEWANDQGAQALASRITRELELHDAMSVAYTKAARAAPPAWRDAEFAKYADLQLEQAIKKKYRTKDNPAGYALMRENYIEGIRGLPPEQNRLLWTHGERLTHNAKNTRAFAMPGEPGSITFNMESVAVVNPRSHTIDTIAHEWAHRVDGVLGSDRYGGNGLAWEARPGFEHADVDWVDAFGNPFEAAKSASRKTVRLPGETASYGKYMWEGRWVNAYEARIYTPKIPTALELANGKNSGPIEFIAMSQTHRTNARVMIKRAILVDRGLAGGSLPVAEGLVSGLKAAETAGARACVATYGRSYVVAQERMFGDGRRLLEALAGDSRIVFKGDGDVYATAVLARELFGTPLDETIGAGGALAGKLSTPWNGVDFPTPPSVSGPAGDVEMAWYRYAVRTLQNPATDYGRKP